MNALDAKLSEIISEDELSYLVFDCNGKRLACFVIETPRTNSRLKVGTEVELVFKETQVSLALDIDAQQVSISNVFCGVITGADTGRILSSVCVEGEGHKINSLISTRSFERMGLCVGLEVFALVKATDVAILWKDEV